MPGCGAQLLGELGKAMRFHGDQWEQGAAFGVLEPFKQVNTDKYHRLLDFQLRQLCLYEDRFNIAFDQPVDDRGQQVSLVIEMLIEGPRGCACEWTF